MSNLLSTVELSNGVTESPIFNTSQLFLPDHSDNQVPGKTQNEGQLSRIVYLLELKLSPKSCYNCVFYHVCDSYLLLLTNCYFMASFCCNKLV